MKKVKIIAVATVAVLGIGGAFAFTKPARLNCGWRPGNPNPVQYIKGTDSGEYSCNGTSGTCTYTTSALTTTCDQGTFVLN